MKKGIAVFVVLLVAACGSTGGGSGGATGVGHDGGGGTGVLGDGGAACDAADAGRDCSLSMPVQGGLAGTLDGQQGCGTGSGAGTGGNLSWTSSVLGGRVTATFTGAVPSQAGTYPLASLEIRATETDGAASTWTAPTGACSITVTSVDVECQGAFREYRHIVHGTGSCTQPAAPASGSSDAPITVGDFQFSHWLDQ